MIFEVFSPAKINLYLHILAQREDGYHDLDSLFAKLNFGDTLTFEDKKEGIEIAASGDFKIPTNAENLAYKAANVLRSRAKGKRGIKITINKRIPLGGGMGGGSSNAATVLRFLNKHWDLHLPQEELSVLGQKLGADIPFFLYDEPFAQVSGIGEKIRPFQNIDLLPKEMPVFIGKTVQEILANEYCIVLVFPKNISIDTAWAYQEFHRFSAQKYSQMENNSFESALFPVFPDLLTIKNLLLYHGALHAAMTGSGSVVFGIFDKNADITDLEHQLSTKGKMVKCGFLSSSHIVY